jgi:predicted ATP-grasp superfamily ATP-dependent carboligase
MKESDKRINNKKEGWPSVENTKNHVVVLGGGLTALGMVRAFGKRGIDVYLIVDKERIAAFSKYCKRSFMAPRSGRDRDILKRILAKIAKGFSKRAVVYPTSDLDALNLAELKDELHDDYYFVVGDKEPVEMIVNKKKFYKALDRNGIDYPATCFPEDLEGVRRIAPKTTYPVFIRPSITQVFNQVLGTGTKGFIAHSQRELVDYYSLATRHGIEVMLQEIIPGQPSNSYQLEGYYNKNYRPTILFARQRLRIWPPGFGNTTLCVSIPITRLGKEKKMVNEFIRTIRYNALMSAEFKEDPRDGKMKFLEINARPWWHFWLAAKCGADIIYHSYLDTIGQRIEYTEEYETGVKSMYLINDLRVLAHEFMTQRLDFPDWVSSLHGVAQFADFERTDSSPFIMDFVTQVFSPFTKRQQRRPNHSDRGQGFENRKDHFA